MSSITPLTPDDVLASLDELPSMPASVGEVIAACDDTDVTVGQLAQVVLRDQSLTASILKLANSAFYGHARTVSTIVEAIVLLGYSAIKSLAISSHTARLLNRAVPGYGLARGDLWQHSMSVAFAARRIAVEVSTAPVEEAFVAGLLHDIGKTVLASHREAAFEEISRLAVERHVPFHHVEAEVLGFDHAELGARVASAWSFPPQLEEAIRFHHDPVAATLRPRLACIVHVADAACMMFGPGIGADGLAYEVSTYALETLDLGANHLLQVMDQLAPLMTPEAFAL